MCWLLTCTPLPLTELCVLCELWGWRWSVGVLLLCLPTDSLVPHLHQECSGWSVWRSIGSGGSEGGWEITWYQERKVCGSYVVYLPFVGGVNGYNPDIWPLNFHTLETNPLCKDGGSTCWTNPTDFISHSQYGAILTVGPWPQWFDAH